jgi:pyrroline-5-carboxylate reductase
MSKTRIAFIGAGNMAASLIGGLRAQGLDATQIRASDPGAETRTRVQAEHGIEVFEDNAQAIAGADVIVLAVKPQVMKTVCEALQPNLQDGQLIVSIAAGITCASLQRAVCHRRSDQHTAPAGRTAAIGRRHRLVA